MQASLLALAEAVVYVAVLAWDRHYDVHADGSMSGPYSNWQVGLFVVSLFVLGTLTRLSAVICVGVSVAILLLASDSTGAAATTVASG